MMSSQGFLDDHGALGGWGGAEGVEEEEGLDNSRAAAEIACHKKTTANIKLSLLIQPSSVYWSGLAQSIDPA